MNGPDGSDSEMLPVASRVNGGDLSLHGEREHVWFGPTCVVSACVQAFLGPGATAVPIERACLRDEEYKHIMGGSDAW